MTMYKVLTVDEAESLFDSGVEGVQFYCPQDGNGWTTWCRKGHVGNREQYFSPKEMIVEYPGTRWRVEVE